MEKRANNSLRKPLYSIWILGLAFLAGFFVQAQTQSFVKGKSYVLDSISVRGVKTFNEQTVITYTGLKQGQKIRIPGEEISSIISKLWKLDLFSDINFYLTDLFLILRRGDTLKA